MGGMSVLPWDEGLHCGLLRHFDHEAVGISWVDWLRGLSSLYLPLLPRGACPLAPGGGLNAIQSELYICSAMVGIEWGWRLEPEVTRRFEAYSGSAVRSSLSLAR